MRQSHKASTRRPPVRGTHAESTEARRRRSTTILSRLRRSHFPTSTALHHSSPLDLLIATILSAQCTDERVNIVTESLFKKYATAADYAAADVRELEAAIRSTGFFRAKAKNIINCCRALVDRHGGRVPESLEELVQLSGVGRKTANVVLGSVFRKTVGVVVDTHVKTCRTTARPDGGDRSRQG